MEKCLVVPGFFVPFNNVTTQLVYKQLRLLPLEYDVCALSNPADPLLEKQLSEDENYQKFHVHWTDRYDNVLFSIRDIDLFKCLRHMKKYIETAVEMYNGQKFLYTSSFPCYTTRVGTILKQKNPSLFWIANFSDPINHSPYKFDERTYRSYSLPEKAAFRLYCKYYVVDEDEAAAFEKADLLLFICQEQRDFMIEQYLKYFGRISEKEIRKKCVIVPLNYVPEWNHLVPAAGISDNGTYVLSHFGRIYGLRIIDEFLYGLRLFMDAHPDVKLSVEQYDEFRKSDLKTIRDLHLSDVIHIHSKIPYEQCLEKMKESNGVLLFDTILPEDEIQPYLPSKILEYSLLEKNVLGITTTRSPAYRIMKESHAIVCSYDRTVIEKGLEKLIIEKVPSIVNYHASNEEAVSTLQQRISEML